MIRFRSLTACAAVAGLLATGVAFAQDGPDGPRGFGPRRGGGPGGPGLPLRALNLTEAQQSQLKSIRDQHREELQQAEAQVRKAMEAQRKAVETVPVNEGLIRSTVQDVAEAQATAAIVQAHIYNETWAVLTSAQQAQVKQLQAERQAQVQQSRDGRGRRQQ